MTAPDVQQFIDAMWSAREAEAADALAAAQAETARLQAIINVKLPGPLGIYDWDEHYSGYPLDLAGYVETFRDDFTVDSITGPTGAGPWYSAVHASFADSPSTFRPKGYSPDPYLVQNGEARIRMEKVAATGKWQSGIIQTMNAQGQGFAQAMGYFEARLRLPNLVAGDKGAPGFWGGPWLLSAAEFHPEITDHLIEIDICEAYGGDRGIHTTVHVKPRLVPQSGDYPTRVGKSAYWNPKETISAVTGQPLVQPGTGIFDGQFHTYGILLDDQWVTAYWDNMSLGRFPMLDYFRTPLYMLVDSTLFASQASAAVSPIDMQVDYVRALAKA
jgi:beta-glucanase (GH16 family)